MLSQARLYLNTARHLRPIQVAGRVWFACWRPRTPRGSAPARRPQLAPSAPLPAKRASITGAATFELLGCQHRLPPSGGWDDAELPKLLRYNLHYFDDLNALDATGRAAWHRALIDRWLAENPPAHGTGWEPYPTSLRIVNWVKWALSGHDLGAAAHDSLATQARWLRRRLEYHLLGNHLLANAKALVFAGLYFEGSEAQEWLAQGRRLLQRQLAEQILTDGGHSELSPMYHCAVLEDLLDLVNLSYAFAQTPERMWLDAVPRMQRWLGAMTHPDGGIAFFNDAAFDIAPAQAELQAYAEQLRLPKSEALPDGITSLAASGYVRARAGAAADLYCDCANLGPEYLPAHAHADTLSFELSVGGRRVIVNSGTSEYGSGAERQRQRGTAAHSTVVIDEQNSSEMWAGFRVARRAHAQLHEATASSRGLTVAASHDGYARLQGRPIHHRRWVLDQGSLTIEDRIDGRFTQAHAYLHVHPDVAVRVSTSDAVVLSAPGMPHLSIEFDRAGAIAVEPGTWHPRFGAAVPNRRIVVPLAQASLTTRIRWDRAP